MTGPDKNNPPATIPWCLCTSSRINCSHFLELHHPGTQTPSLFSEKLISQPTLPHKISISKLLLPGKDLGSLRPAGLYCLLDPTAGHIYMAAEDWKAKVSFYLGKGTARALLRSEGNIQSRLLSSRIERFLVNLAVMPLQCCHSCCHLSLVPPKTQKENCWQCPLRIDLRDYP